MEYYKRIEGDYITAIGKNMGGTEITEVEYNQILAIILTKPAATETTDFRLKVDLTWEEYEVPPQPEPEPTAEELLDILVGGAE